MTKNMQILPHQFDSERGYFGQGGTKEGRQPRKKGFDVWWEEGRINERRRERADCRTARCSSFKNDATVFLLSSLHLATLVDRGWPSEAVDKRGGDPPLPSGKVPKAKQNGPTTTGMQREGHVSAFPKCIIWPCINFPWNKILGIDLDFIDSICVLGGSSWIIPDQIVTQSRRSF